MIAAHVLYIKWPWNKVVIWKTNLFYVDRERVDVISGDHDVNCVAFFMSADVYLMIEAEQR